MNPIDPMKAVDGTSAVNGPARQKIEKSAQEFEGMLLSALWKTMGDDMKSAQGEDSSGSSFIDMGLQAVGSAMAKSGGVGIGRMLLKALDKEQSKEAGEVHGPK